MIRITNTKSLYDGLRNFAIILGGSMAFFLLLFGVGYLINPEVPESYLAQNTRICMMMIITGVVSIYAIFRPFSGGILLCICAAGLGFIFGGFLRNPITPGVMLIGGFFILAGYLSRRKPPEDPKKPT